MRNTPEGFGLIAGAIAAAEAGFELIRVIVTHGRITGWFPASTYASSAIFIIVLSLAAIGLALRKPWGFVTGVLGVVVSLGQAAILLVPPGPNIGVAYVIGGFAILFCLAKSIPSYRTGATPT